MTATRLTILDQIRKGDLEAREIFAATYFAYSNSLLRWLGLKDEHEREDLSQEIVLLALRDVPDFQHRGPGSLRAWLATIARRSLYRYRERCRAKHCTFNEELFAQLEDEHSELSRRIEQEHARAVTMALWSRVRAELSERDRTIVEQLVFQEQPSETVAAQSGASIATIYAVKSRAFKRLRELAAIHFGSDELLDHSSW